jgi:DNA-directed RNA polymerase beta' subunit
VGIIAAQSIGQKTTQTTLNTFHKAGMSEKTMTKGVPRFQELLNATKKPNIVNHRIIFRDSNSEKTHGISDIRKMVGSNLVELFVENLLKNVRVDVKSMPGWYEILSAMGICKGTKRAKNFSLLKLKFLKRKLFEFRVTLEAIAKAIERNVGGVKCICGPLDSVTIIVRINVSEEFVRLGEDREIFSDVRSEVRSIYVEETVIPLIKNIRVCGVPGIKEVFYAVDEKTGNVFAETISVESKKISGGYSSLKRVMDLPHVDPNMTTSSHPLDILEVLGIEAARSFLIEEFESAMPGINHEHAQILFDRMTFDGLIKGITRYTLRKNAQGGVLNKASFEETQDNFVKAAMKGEREIIKEVSASIICSNRAKCGTGMSRIHLRF